MKKIALITGVTLPYGYHLVKILVKKRYIFHALVRRGSSYNTKRISYTIKDGKYIYLFFFHYGDLTGPLSLARLFDNINPKEIYNLGAQKNGTLKKKLLDISIMIEKGWNSKIMLENGIKEIYKHYKKYAQEIIRLVSATSLKLIIF